MKLRTKYIQEIYILESSEMKNYFKHETAIIESNSKIGKDTKIWGFSHIMNGAIVGSNCNIGEHVFIEDGVTLGNNVKVKNNVSLYSGLECKDYVFIGPSSVFTNVINPRSHISRKNEFKKTIIDYRSNYWANATIICGIKIGKHAFVGAGSVVTKDIPDFVMVLGNPAKFYSYVCTCGYLIDNKNLICKECNKKYKKVQKGLAEYNSYLGDD